MPINVDSRRHPQGKSLSQALRDDADGAKQQKKAGINKRVTLIKDPDTSAESLGIGATMCPDVEQLSRINKFTRREVTCDEVVAFSTLSMNDIPDRDDDVFTTETVQEFAALEGPLSSVGKSYMVDHEYKTANAHGRIFGVGTQKVGKNLFLTNEVYVPNTPQFAGFIEKIDFGINWAVSVGVMLGASECSLSFCKEPFGSLGWWCNNGHDKGLHYVKDAEEDSWGFPVTSDPAAKGAEKCLRNFKQARDFYELSQVFLGAQYNAAISEKGILAAAKAAGVPMLGLSEDEAAEIPMRRLPRKVEEAYQKGLLVETGEDGVMSWKDADRRVWLFDPDDSKSGVVNLGKEAESTDNNEEVKNGSEELEQLHEGNDSDGEEHSSTEVDPNGDDDGAEDHPAEDSAESGSQPGSGLEGQSTESEEEDEVPKEAILAMARAAGLSNEIVKAASGGKGNGLEALLLAAGTRCTALENEVKGLKPKAQMGDEYVTDLKKQALDAYIAVKTTGDTAVDTDRFERMLDKCSDDVDLLKGIIEENKSVAQERFPKSVRRSSFPSDPHDKPIPSNTAGDDAVSDAKVSKLHR